MFGKPHFHRVYGVSAPNILPLRKISFPPLKFDGYNVGVKLGDQNLTASKTTSYLTAPFLLATWKYSTTAK